MRRIASAGSSAARTLASLSSVLSGTGVGVLLAFLLVLKFNIPGSIAPIVIGLFTVAGMAVTASIRQGGDDVWIKQWQVAAFCDQNGFNYVPFSDLSVRRLYPGYFFRATPQTLVSPRILSGKSERFFDIGMVMRPAAGAFAKGRYVGYMVLKLEKSLPHIVLDAKSNDGFRLGFRYSELTKQLSREQVVDLGAPFSDYFTLYCPQGYETDALYVLSPRVMELLIAGADAFDVEIVDDYLMLYAPGSADFFTEASMRHLFAIADSVGAVTLQTTSHYYDPSVGFSAAKIVAPAGRRLGNRVWPKALIGCAALVWGLVLLRFFAIL